MNAPGDNLSRKSICATCLSQDRKLFPVNDSKSRCWFLNLSEGDALCWECHFFLLKVTAFQSRAAKAQALLASLLHRHTNASIMVNSLSTLTITPITLDVNLGSPDCLRVLMKAEAIKDEPNNTYDCPIEDTRSNCDASNEENGNRSVSLVATLNGKEARGDESFGEAMGDEASSSLKFLLSRKSTPIKKPPTKKIKKNIPLPTPIEQNTHNSYSVTCDDSDDDGMVNVTLLPVLKGAEAKGDEGFEAMGDDLANASLKSLLSRKSTLLNVPAAPKKPKVYDMVTIEIDELTDRQTPIGSDNLYTVKMLSEEEMLEWRERKKNSEYYVKCCGGLRCTQCIEPFMNKKFWASHERRHEEMYGAFACDICGLRSVSESALGEHRTQHYRLLKCNLCGHEWDSRNALRQHCSVAHGVPVTVWDCDQCDKQYSSSARLTQHTVVHREASCRVCGARVGQTMLKNHMRSHTHRPLRTCGECGRECKGDEGLAAHMKSHDKKVHEDAFCAECNMQFRTLQLYRNHRRYARKHIREEDMTHKCGECGKLYMQRSHLAFHVESVHTAEPKYACKVCGRKYKTTKAKSNHERRVHSGGAPARNCVCDYCGKAFQTKAILQQHINTHTGARPFVCALCGAAFGHSAALYLHGRYKHKIKKKSERTAEENGKKVEGSRQES